jgi:hypothetical protein
MRNFKFETDYSVNRGKQWQTTPKNMLRMQRARAIPVAWLDSVLPKPAQGLNTNQSIKQYR